MHGTSERSYGPLMHGFVFLGLSSLPFLLSIPEATHSFARGGVMVLLLAGSPLNFVAFKLIDNFYLPVEPLVFVSVFTVVAYFIYGVVVGKLAGPITGFFGRVAAHFLLRFTLTLVVFFLFDVVVSIILLGKFS